MANTQTGLPYPVATDAVSGGAAAIQALANAVDTRPKGLIDQTSATDSAAGTVSGVERKDATMRDITVVVPAGTARSYRIVVSGRLQVTVGATTADVLVRDGGTGSPTTSSPIVDGCAGSLRMETASGAGADEFVLDKLVTLTAGTHKLAVFFKRTSGTGEVSFGQSSNGKRQIAVHDAGVWVAP